VFIAESIPRYGAINRSHPLARGLLAAWYVLPGMASGNKLHDLAGNNHGTLTNGPTWRGNALSFDGTNDYVDFGDALDMGLRDWTSSLWFKTTDTNAALINKSFYGAAAGRWWTAIASGVVELGFDYGTAVSVTTASAAYTDGRWHCVTSVYDRDGSATLYLDGIARASTSIAAGSAVDFNTAYHLFLGRYNNQTTGTVPHVSDLIYNGQMRDITIHARALSAAEVKAIYVDPLAMFHRTGTPIGRVASSPPPGNRRRRLIMGAAT
jgi:hypothetical protein